ncbi:uncharacterized protein LOC107364878 [Tetranychus urticae]|uniref:uncharacterized protein LOC107364878 n=1 Tax=Tetranychus urticae TaxID=32264 RepID=UPI00077BDFAE|nr:uncharacterized protein LOC107364878 [Tetranychus urticae]
MSTDNTNDKQTIKLLDEWNINQNATIDLAYEAINDPTKYIAFKDKYTIGDINKTVLAMASMVKKDKEETDLTLKKPTELIEKATKVSIHFAEIAKLSKSTNKRTNNGGENNNKTGSKRNTRSKKNTGSENDTDNPETASTNNLATINDDDMIEIDTETLNAIVDEDNVAPSKRRKVISKTYMEDEDEEGLQPGWYAIQHNNSKPIINLKHKTKENITAEEFKNEVENTLVDEDLEYGDIEKITKGNKVITIHFEDIKSRDKFVKYVKSKQSNWVHEIPTLRNPCVRINGVINRNIDNNGEIDWDLWSQKILNKNKWIPKNKGSIFMVNKKSVVAKGEKFNVVIEVSPNVRQAIVKKRGKIFSGICKYDVYDNFNVLACYQCASYGHTTNTCGQQPVCNFCSRQHIHACPIYGQTNKYKCPGCKKNGHSFNDPNCTEFIWRLQYELQFINMNYSMIMTPKTKTNQNN